MTRLRKHLRNDPVTRVAKLHDAQEGAARFALAGEDSPVHPIAWKRQSSSKLARSPKTKKLLERPCPATRLRYRGRKFLVSERSGTLLIYRRLHPFVEIHKSYLTPLRSYFIMYRQSYGVAAWRCFQHENTCSLRTLPQRHFPRKSSQSTV